MATRKDTALLMTKLPEPGRVKTRLTRGQGGPLTSEVASFLYHSMLLDVVETIMAALHSLESVAHGTDSSDAFDFMIATPRAEDIAPLTQLIDEAGPWPCGFEVVTCEGESFWACLDHAIRECFARGASSVLALRGDCPTLSVDDVKRGFLSLHKLEADYGCGMVLAPDQHMGVSVVGLTRKATFSHEGSFGSSSPRWVLPSYIDKAAQLGLAVSCLPAVPDVDTMDDLIQVATVVQALNYSAAFDGTRPPWRTAAALFRLGFREAIVRPKSKGQ